VATREIEREALAPTVGVASLNHVRSGAARLGSRGVAAIVSNDEDPCDPRAGCLQVGKRRANDRLLVMCRNYDHRVGRATLLE